MYLVDPRISSDPHDFKIIAFKVYPVLKLFLLCSPVEV